MTRIDRAHELNALRACNPERLVELYWQAINSPPTSQLPLGISFSKMIETILDHEMTAGKLQEDPRPGASRTEANGAK